MLTSWKIFACVCPVVAGVVGSAAASMAQGVMDQARPGFDAKGIPISGFRLFPTLDVGASFDDNVYRLATPQSDWIFEEAAKLQLESQWGRHFLEAYIGADNYDYAKYMTLNLTDWTAGVDGRYDIIQGADISASGSYGEYHEPLYSPNTAGNQASPNRFNKVHAQITGVYQPNRLGFSGGLSFDRYTFQNAPLFGGGIINNADRNEDEYQAYGRALYNFSPGYTVFLKASYDGRAFDQALDRSDFNRASHGLHFDAGVDLALTDLIHGEAYVGYLKQYFNLSAAPTLKDISGLDFGGALDWYATTLMTVHLTASHAISDVVIADVSASNDQSVKLSADYELDYKLLVTVYGAFTQSRLTGINRTDSYPSAGVTVKYLLDEYLSSDLGYTFSNRSSTTPGGNYNDNLISLNLTGHI